MSATGCDYSTTFREYDKSVALAGKWIAYMHSSRDAIYEPSASSAPEVKYAALRERYVLGEISLEAFGVKVEALLQAGL